MVKLILVNRWRRNTRDGWYLAASCALVALMVGAFLASRSRYERHRELYTAQVQTRIVRLEQANMYRNVSAGLDLPPSPLSVVSRGVTGTLGSSATVWGRFGRTEITRLDEDFAGPSGSLLEIDMARVIAWMASFLAVFLVHDTVNGQRAGGVLKMVLARPVSRSAFLLGEAGGHFLTVALPVVLALAACAVLVDYLGLPFESGDWIRYALFSGLSLAYVAGWVLLSLLLSILCPRPATSLVTGMTLWVFVTALCPSGAAWASTHAVKDTSALVQLPHRDWSKPRQRPAPLLSPAEKRRHEDSWNSRVRQHRLHHALRALTPASAYLRLSEDLCQSGVEVHLAFMRDLRALETVFEAWQTEKLERYPERASRYVYGAEPLDLTGLPEPRPARETWGVQVEGLFAPASLQLGLLALLTVGSHLAFRRLDVR